MIKKIKPGKYKFTPRVMEYVEDEKDPRLAKYNLKGYNKPKRTPDHPKKSHIVLAKEGERSNLYALVSKVLKLLVNLKKVNQKE